MANGILVLQKFRLLMKLQAVCDLRGVQFTAHLPLGHKDGVRLSLTSLLSTAVGRPALHPGPQPAKTILRLPEMNVVPLGDQSLVLTAVDNVLASRADTIVRWFRNELSFACSFDDGLV